MQKSVLLRSAIRAILILQLAAALTAVPVAHAAAAAAAEETTEETMPAKKPKAAKPKTAKTEKKAATDTEADPKPDKKAPKPAKPAKPATAVKNIPFHGVVTAVDPEAKTVTLGTKVFNITDATLVVDGDKSAVLKDVKVGRKIGGSYHVVKTRNEVVKLNLGVKQESTPAKPKKTK